MTPLRRLLGSRSAAGQSRVVGRIAFTQKPVEGSWGGSNQFVKQIERTLSDRGLDVVYDLENDVDVIVVVDPRKAANKPLGSEEVEAYKRDNPRVKVLHRVNECDLRKNTDFMDDMLARANQCADFTVFISDWLRAYHTDRWFDSSKPHSVVYNGADARFFYPSKDRPGRDGILRFVTHHWAGSYSKGFDVYRRMDELIADGTLKDVILRVIGRWPEDIEWRTAETLPPVQGMELGDRLRECHAYITASRWEPCGMHQVEGIQCGLPLVYHGDGGGIVEVGRKCGVEIGDSLVNAVEELRRDYFDYRARAIDLDLGGDRMCMEFARLIRRLMYADC